MCSLGSPGFGCVVYRIVCVAMSAASGVFGMMFPCSSTDKKDDSRILERYRLSECSIFSTHDSCLLCLPLFVCDALLCASCIALLAALTDSLLFPYFACLLPAVLIADIGSSGILEVPLCMRPLGWLCRVLWLL
jgi:hypothetical protein